MAPRIGSAKRRRFDPESVKKALVDMIILDELPFSVVEDGEFADRMEAAFPGFHMPSSETISRACVQFFTDEKSKLKSFIKATNQSVCLSLDTWMSKQSVNYLCITAHFIDNDWNLHKIIIGFSTISVNGGDNGDEIGKAVEKCLNDWGINNVLAVSAGNETVNDAAVSYLGTRLTNPVLGGKFLRLKCFADFTNKMVKQVLKDYDELIEHVRVAVRYMLQSPARIKKFEDFARQHRMPSSDSCLFLDSPTIWLSTYDMLDKCYKFKDVFNWFEEKDPMYKTSGNPCIEWENVRKAVCCLTGLFWLIGDEKLDPNVSDVTANSFFGQIVQADFGLVDDELSCVRKNKLFFKPVEMKWKYNEYWGDVHDSNMLIHVATILDPRYKIDYIECSFGLGMTFKYVYTNEGEFSWKKKAELVVSATYNLFNEYVKKFESPHQLANFQTSGYNNYLRHATCSLQMGERREVGFGGNVGQVSEIDEYLNEEVMFFDGFDILVWWEANAERFPVLSKMAKDVLAIPMSAVELMKDHNIDGNLLGDVQSSVSPSMAEALVCAQNWINKSKNELKEPGGSTELDNLVKGIYEELVDTSSESGSYSEGTSSESGSNSEVTSSERWSNST